MNRIGAISDIHLHPEERVSDFRSDDITGAFYIQELAAECDRLFINGDLEDLRQAKWLSKASRMKVHEGNLKKFPRQGIPRRVLRLQLRTSDRDIVVYGIRCLRRNFGDTFWSSTIQWMAPVHTRRSNWYKKIHGYVSPKEKLRACLKSVRFVD